MTKVRYLFSIIILFSHFAFTAHAQVDPDLLASTALERAERVPEFNFIIQEAKKLGVKVYLFGGTASAYAHYVRWDLEREAGDDKYQLERFDYDFTNIYRGNQDLDIVVDGTPEQAEELRERLKQKYPHFVGNREAWEVRLLKTKTGDKLPLLGDTDFTDQHSDTNSTGMIALNPNPKNELTFRDLHDWSNPKSRFLSDVANAKITYLFSKQHEQTERYKEDLNPPVLSAVRYIAKLTQYEVIGTEADMKIIKSFIQSAQSETLSDYAKKKIIEFGLKALRNAPNIEYAWDVLDKTGLRDLVTALDGNDISNANTASWWMNKEPLRTSPLAQNAEGRTAREVFGDDEIIISHETQSFEAYESITRSAKGDANVFISREDAVGEAAVHGNGFYAQVGKIGARGTGITIRFKLHPDAIEGVDFTSSGDIVVIKNKAALELIQENIHLTLYNFFTLLTSGQISDNDKGLLEKLRRKFTRYKADHAELSQIEQDFFQNENSVLSIDALNYWFSNEGSINFPQTVDYVSQKHSCDDTIICLLAQVHWHPYLKESFPIDDILKKDISSLDRALVVSIIQNGLGNNLWENNPELLAPFLVSTEGVVPTYAHNLIEHVLPNKPWSDYPKILIKLLEDKITTPGGSTANLKVLTAIAEHVLSQEHWSRHTHVVEKLAQRIAEYPYSTNDTKQEEIVAKYVFAKPHYVKHHTIVSFLIKRSHKDQVIDELIEHALPYEHWTEHPYLIDEIIENRPSQNSLVIEHILSKKHWWPYVKKYMDAFIKDQSLHSALSKYVLTQDFAVNDAYISEMVVVSDVQPDLIEFVLSHKKHKNPDLLKSLMTNSHNHYAIVEHILSQDHWSDEPDLLNPFLSGDLTINDDLNSKLITHVFTKPFWKSLESVGKYLQKLLEEQRHTNLLIKTILSDNSRPQQKKWVEEVVLDQNFLGYSRFEDLLEHVLSDEKWHAHPDVFLKIIGLELSTDQLSLLAINVLKNPYWANQPEVLFAFAKKKSGRKILIKSVIPFAESPTYKSFLEETLTNFDFDDDIARYVLSNEVWTGHPDLVVRLVADGLTDPALEKYVFSKPSWKNHPVLKAYLGSEDVNSKNIRDKNRMSPFLDWYKAFSPVHMCRDILK